MTTAIDTPTLPSRAELHEAWEAVATAWDEKGAGIYTRAAKLVNLDELPPVSIAEVGALLTFVHETRGLLDGIRSDLDLLEEITLYDLAAVERDGTLGHVPTVDELGIRRHEN